MATEAIFTSLRLRTSPSLEAFLVTTVDLSDVSLVQTLASVSAELVSCFRSVRFSFQRRNARSLIRKIEVLLVLFEYLSDDSGWDSTAVMCFKELYIFLHRSKLLLQYCAQSSKLWLLLQTPSLSDFFHHLNRDLSNLLDVFPFNSLNLSDDIREQLELLQQQATKSTTLFVDHNEELLRERFYTFLNGFENGEIPNTDELRSFFVEKLGIKDPKSCRDEIEFLEEQISKHDCDDLEPSRSVVNAFVSITRYCMYSLFAFEDGVEWSVVESSKKQRKCLVAEEMVETFTTLPKDFVCSISLSLMKDPVIVSTGQTYDRSSIVRWFEEGYFTCPKTGQKLVDSSCIVPNRALRELITRWCAATEFGESPEEESPVWVMQTRASMAATKATVLILIQHLAGESELAQVVAAREIRLLAKTVRERGELIAEAGAVPHLVKLLKSQNAVVQEQCVTAMLNLSVCECELNKSLFRDENDCLESIVSVLASGLTLEARGNAAATLYCLSTVHEYRKLIANADGCIESLVLLLQNGKPRGRKDAIKALSGIWRDPDNHSKMINSGGVLALVKALADEDEAVAERAVVVLAVVANHSLGAVTIGREESAVAGLIELMRCGTPRGKENAVATLLHLCVNGGAVVVEKVVRAPALTGLTEKVLRTGTDRGKRKATALLGLFLDGCENTAMMRFVNREGGFETHVSLPPISVPVSVL
ncbi:PREDICTED: U-box domain-containing protein 17-like [Camelina sativa]|uniref:RING-type E3 ubiquitin transferase n=1 Tax=Camelina sativa TaxID=90675 RepID=A0ABM0Z370_CAMSA|nr:PREDICTED: U-box domain-containing protein 17-like [Camelina sativa]